MIIVGTNAVKEIQNAMEEHTWEIKGIDGLPDRHCGLMDEGRREGDHPVASSGEVSGQSHSSLPWPSCSEDSQRLTKSNVNPNLLKGFD